MDKMRADEIIADLLSSSLMRAHEEGRRHLYVWEACGLAFLADERGGDINAWTAARVRAFAKGAPILAGWSTEPYPIAWVRDRPPAPRSSDGGG